LKRFVHDSRNSTTATHGLSDQTTRRAGTGLSVIATPRPRANSPAANAAILGVAAAGINWTNVLARIG
jgi:hypothetical protein